MRGAALLALALAVAACSDDGALNPRAEKFDGAPQLLVNADSLGVRISEIHYDNTGTDAGEAIEISAPANHDFFGWRIVLYNGSGGAQYDSDLIPIVGHTQCGTRKVAVINYPANGIQNGSPDGIALVDANGAVVEFLSYEGTFVAVGGAANGLTSTDIGVAQAGTEPLGHSLQRTSYTNNWVASNPGDPGKFGACNDNGPPPPPPVVASVLVIPATATIDQGLTQQFVAMARDANGQTINNVTFTWSSSATAVATVNQSGLATAVLAGATDITATAPNGVVGTATLNVNAPPPPPTLPAVRFSEIHYDNFGTDIGEAIELEGPAGTDLTGWSIVLYNGTGGGSYDTRVLSGSINGSCTTLTGRGIAYFEYPSNGIQNGAPDGMALVDNNGQLVEFLSYEGTLTATNGPAAGKTSTDIVALQNSSPFGQTLQRDQNGAWALAGSTIGGCNSGGPVSRANIIAFSGRLSTDPPLPVGFEDQVFATLITPVNGDTIRTVTFTWSSVDATVASVDQDGVVHALAAGSAIIRATASDGSTATHTLPTVVATASASALYGNHIEFGAPADLDNSDDEIVVRSQYIASFNKNKNIPNWAANNLEQTHFGAQPRCDCFTYDPQLPASFTRYTTADYTGAGAAAGYGIDRGHLVRSFDREAGNLDNATTYYFSNIVPQAADNNQGPWAAFENFVGAFAQNGGSEVYVIAGASGSKGTVKDEGIITIPSAMWKVAIVMPRDKGLNDVDSYDDVTVYAVIMPNDPGIRSVPWQTYARTVDEVEALSGYNLLALLPDHIEIAVESNTKPPVGQTNGPFSSNEGSSVSFSAAGSSDADGHALTFAWSFGDGASAAGSAATHTYAQDGSYNVQLVVTDALGLADTVNTTATVANVAPNVAAFDGAVLLPGETYSVNGSFTDPGADSWSATVDYGDGAGALPLALTGKTFTLAHTYLNPGSYTVTVVVQDDDVSTLRTQTVVVLTPVAAIDNIDVMVDELLAAGKLSKGNANSLQVKLDSASASIAAGDFNTAVNQLNALLHELDAMVRSSRLSPADEARIRAEVQRVIDSIED
ncbi:MAG TPA: DNA/RNA non-specific endonuclease [Longimicrobiales bacterium]